MVWVVKEDGGRVPFDAGKVARTSMRAGSDEATAQKIALEVSARVRDGMRTRDILRLTLRLLQKYEGLKVAARYDLKGAIMRLGPAGFNFETFFAEVLGRIGYTTSVRQMVKGACISHEIDIVAVSPEGKRFMVECKYRNASGDYIKVKEALYTYARFLDLVDGHAAGQCEKFDGAWLATNTKFSTDVLQYAACKGIKFTSWRLPAGESLAELVEGNGVYPITILRSLDSFSQKRLAAAGLMTCRDLNALSAEDVRGFGIPRGKTESLLAEARDVCSGIGLAGGDSCGRNAQPRA